MDVFTKILIFILSIIIGVEALELLGFSSEQISIISYEQFSFKTFLVFTALFAVAQTLLVLIAKKTKLISSTSKS